MKKKYLLALSVFIITVIIYSRNKIYIDAYNIKKVIEKVNTDGISEQIIIDKKYKIYNKVYKTSGKGVIFLEDNYSFFYEYDKKCIMKLPYADELMIQNDECPIYRMFAGMKFKIANEDNGVFNVNEEYIFKDKNINNFVLIDNFLYTIEKFNEKEMVLSNNKIIKNDYIKINGNGLKQDPYILIKKA